MRHTVRGSHTYFSASHTRSRLSTCPSERSTLAWSNRNYNNLAECTGPSRGSGESIQFALPIVRARHDEPRHTSISLCVARGEWDASYSTLSNVSDRTVLFCDDRELSFPVSCHWLNDTLELGYIIDAGGQHVSTSEPGASLICTGRTTGSVALRGGASSISLVSDATPSLAGTPCSLRISDWDLKGGAFTFDSGNTGRILVDPKCSFESLPGPGSYSGSGVLVVTLD